MKNCTFCKIIKRQIPGYILDEDDDIIVFLSLENHPLVVPKSHIPNIYELGEDTGAKVMKSIIHIAPVVKRALNSDGIYITQANDPAAGQDVFHLHFHIYPRWENQVSDGLAIADEKERETTFQKIKSAM